MGYDSKFPQAVCPICSGNTFATLDGSTTTPAVVCQSCFLGIELSVSEDPTNQYFPGTYDPARNNTKSTTSRWGRFHHDCAIAHQRMQQCATVLNDAGQTGALWVDVGACNGATLVTARRRGWDVVAIESDDAACEALNKVLGIHAATFSEWLVSGTLRDKCSVISMFDVLEHILDFPAVIRAAAGDLKAGGIVIVEVPDLEHFVRTAGDAVFSDWKHRRVNAEVTEHQYHFTQASLKKAFEVYAPALKLIHAEVPVEGKLQCVFTKTATTEPTPVDPIAELVQYALTLPNDKYTELLEVLRSRDAAVADAVEAQVLKAKS